MKSALRLAILFAGRIGGMLVAVLFLPLYAKLLSQEEFGLATLVITGQTLALNLDFGMSTLAMREAAASRSENSLLMHIFSSENLLFIFYILIFLISLIIFYIYRPSLLLITACLAMYFFIALQNVYQSIILGRSKHYTAAIIQVVGILFRATLSILALYFIQATIVSFVLSQMLGALIQMLFTRSICMESLNLKLSTIKKSIDIFSIFKLAKKGFPLFFVGISGAVALTFDKPTVSLFMNPKVLAPYFLACTFSLTPLSILSAPIVQFFQPKIVQAYTTTNNPSLTDLIIKLNIALIIIVVVPTLIIWFFRGPLIRLWLQQESYVTDVSLFSSWLLPAAAVGALGYAPITLMVAASDFSFQAKLSFILTSILVLMVVYHSVNNSIIGVCTSFLLYYLLASLSAWARCIMLMKPRHTSETPITQSP